MTSSISTRPRSTSAARVVVGLLAAAAVALIGNALVALVRRFVRRPRAVLPVLVPVVVVLTFGADLALLAGGTTLLNVVGLMLMHVVVAAALVPALVRVLPLPR